MFSKGLDGVIRQTEDMALLSYGDMLPTYRKSGKERCAAPECGTFLNMYNPSNLCSLCQRTKLLKR